MYNEKVALIILDGWGINPNPATSAIAFAQTPCMDLLCRAYPNTTLTTFGEQVGLPEGQMGNSEVGHLNIGAGRIVYQDLQRINVAMKTGEMEQSPVLKQTIEYAQIHQKKIHLMGLLSDGGVHAHIEHLKYLCQLLHKAGAKKAYLHAFTDGRDTDPKSGKHYIEDMLSCLRQTGVQLATLTGRYYAMDRDKRWERIKIAYDVLTKGIGTPSTDILKSIETAYNNGITDEFIQPIYMTNAQGEPLATVQPGDVVICFNFRTDRCRQITQALTQIDLPEFGMNKMPLYYITMTRYDDSFENIQVVFEKDKLQNTLGEVLAQNGKTQIRIAETEKYPHVTFFFSGGRETPFEGEKRILIPSPKVATYDLQPQMSAFELTNAILPEIVAQDADFICLNFANTDMVGHTGIFEAAVAATETVDTCLQKIVTTALENNYVLLVIADHGNADLMINPDGSPNTAHTTNPVPIVLVAKNIENIALKNGKLADIAPTILKIMGIVSPKEMTGEVLLFEK